MRYALVSIATVLMMGLIVGCELVRTPEDCDADLQAMQQVVVEAVNTGLSCHTNSDCVALDVTNGCFGACPVAVSRDALTTIQTQISDADKAYCRNYAEQCGYSLPLCVESAPACVQGSCQMVDPMAGL